MKNQWVKSLQPGHAVATYFGIFDISIGKTKSGGKFLKLLIGDRTGTVEGRVWDPALAEDLYRELSPGDVAIVHGTVTEFNGLQVNIEACMKADKSDIDLNDFRPVTEKDIAEMRRQLQVMIERIGSPHLSNLLEAIFTPEFLDAFSTATAARQVHHAYAGGLLEHTLEVMEYCITVTEVQGERLNGDLLLTGAMLHDVGKLWEYDQSGLTFRRTGIGQLLGGHVILGHDFLRDKLAEIEDFPEGLAVHLDHLILSHHGQREWGAVEEPRTIEAVALHHADLMSARINQVGQMVKSHRGPDSWTSYDRRLGRSIYIP